LSDANTHPQGQRIDMENYMENSTEEMSLFQDIDISSIEFIKNNSGDNSPQTSEKYLSGRAGRSTELKSVLLPLAQLSLKKTTGLLIAKQEAHEAT
jgi:hypothetical protein